ncbi:MAG: helix-turn-helix domain-containing protein [Paracoccus sp. (in: a-proteobacteria)]
MSRRGKGELAPVARRIRFLRGEETQEAFAKRAGISRSALANYETGRSTPDSFTLSKIAKNCDISEDYFASKHDPIGSVPSGAAILGIAVEGVPDWTDDEAAIVRMLRICDQEAVRQIVGSVLAVADDQEVTARLSAIYTIGEDIQRLVEIHERKREYTKGPLATYPDDSPLHRIGFKMTKQEGPQ